MFLFDKKNVLLIFYLSLRS